MCGDCDMFGDKCRKKLLTFVSSEEQRKRRNKNCGLRLGFLCCFLVLFVIGAGGLPAYFICNKILGPSLNSNSYSSNSIPIDENHAICILGSITATAVLFTLCCCGSIFGYSKLQKYADKKGRNAAHTEATKLIEEKHCYNL